MNSDLNEWLKLIIRWAHVFAGIMWVGTTYFFTWLDGRFGELAEKAASAPESSSPEKHVWMVHSGGFYAVEKLKVPSVMPKKLHWFRWEAAITWLTGVLLMILVYYEGGLMVSLDDSRVSQSAAVWLSVGLMLAAWPVYNLLWFKVVKDDTVGVVLSGSLVLALTWFVSRYMTGRAAYLQVGAMFGTIMAFNVWMRILPAQRRMVAALAAGQEPNQAEAFRAKSCSKHNTFLAVPVVFIMLSNHFPSITYGQRSGWVILSVLIFIGWGVAKWIRRAA